MEPQSVIVEVADLSQVGEARRAASLLAQRAGLGEAEQGKVALVATELASNLAKHAHPHGGHLLLRALSHPHGSGVELLSVDRGRGMDDVARCFSDGFSTAGTRGAGLGAVRRNAQVTDVWSRPDKGTVLLAQVWTKAPAGESARVEVGAVCLPIKGEQVSGDAWGVQQQPQGTRVIVADGLGHGPAAAEASLRALEAFRHAAGYAPRDVLERVHLALRPTRGAAVAVAEVDLLLGAVRFAGVGNISACILGEKRTGLVSVHGTAGAQARTLQEYQQPFPPGALLVLHSDGLTTHWSLDGYPGLRMRHPSLVAALLWRDHARGRDDVSVVALREARAP